MQRQSCRHVVLEGGWPNYGEVEAPVKRQFPGWEFDSSWLSWSSETQLCCSSFYIFIPQSTLILPVNDTLIAVNIFSFCYEALSVFGLCFVSSFLFWHDSALATFLPPAVWVAQYLLLLACLCFRMLVAAIISVFWGVEKHWSFSIWKIKDLLKQSS